MADAPVPQLATSTPTKPSFWHRLGKGLETAGLDAGEIAAATALVALEIASGGALHLSDE